MTAQNDKAHTPGPWVILRRDGVTTVAHPLESGGHKIVCNNMMYYPWRPAIADMELMVHAVNSHAALAKALEALVSLPVRYNGNRIEIDCASHSDAMERVRNARALLRQSGERK